MGGVPPGFLQLPDRRVDGFPVRIAQTLFAAIVPRAWRGSVVRIHCFAPAGRGIPVFNFYAVAWAAGAQKRPLRVRPLLEAVLPSFLATENTCFLHQNRSESGLGRWLAFTTDGNQGSLSQKGYSYVDQT